MTTSVKISVPRPNHKRVQIEQLDHVDGDNAPTVFARQVLNHGEEAEFYVYDIRQLRISEID